MKSDSPTSLDPALLSPAPGATYPMGLAWSSWLLTTLFALVQFFLQLSAGDIVVGVMSSFSLSAISVSLVLGVYYYIYAALQIPAGFIVDRFGARAILSLGALICALGCILFATTEHLILAILGRLLMGGGASVSFLGVLYIARRWFPVRRFTFMVACTEMIGMLGIVIGTGYIAVLIQKWGWRHAMLGAAALLVFIAVLIALFVRNHPRSRPAHFVPLQAGVWQELKALLKTSKLWIIATYTGLLFSALTTFVALWAIPYFQLAYGMSLSRASLASMVAFCGVAIGSPIFGWLDGRTTWRRSFLTLSALVCSGLLLLLIYVPHLPLSAIFIGMGLLGVFASAYLVPFGIGAEISPPQRHGASTGFINMMAVGMAPLLIQPLIGGVLDLCLIHRGGSSYAVRDYQWALSVLPITVALTALLVFAMPKKRKE